MPHRSATARHVFAGYDFRRLFTISEYCDRDRQAFYQAIQSVREQNMNLTSWLEFFSRGLATQLQETVERGRLVIHCSKSTCSKSRQNRDTNRDIKCWGILGESWHIRPDLTSICRNRDCSIVRRFPYGTLALWCEARCVAGVATVTHIQIFDSSTDLDTVIALFLI
jgi:hypothetical protein